MPTLVLAAGSAAQRRADAMQRSCINLVTRSMFVAGSQVAATPTLAKPQIYKLRETADGSYIMSNAEKTPERNSSEKRRRKAAKVACFVKAAGRKAQKGKEPNDRSYDHEYAKKIRRMKPEEFDRLLRDESEE